MSNRRTWNRVVCTAGVVACLTAVGPVSAKEHGRGQGGPPQDITASPDATQPPGLAAHEHVPPGLKKNDKTPPGWKKGKKRGWLKLKKKHPSSDSDSQ